MSAKRRRPEAANPGPAGRERAKKKKKKQHMMRRVYFALIVIAVILLVIVAIRFIMGAVNRLPRADVTTLTLLDNGEIVYEEIVPADETMSEDEVEKFIKEELAAYNEAHGDRAIKLDKLSIEDGTAYQKTTYKDAVCYSDFTDFELYAGKLSDAIAAGYDFDTTFVSVYQGMLGDEVSSDMAVAESGLSVLIIRENGFVRVPGDIRYVSSNGVRLADRDLAEIVRDECRDCYMWDVVHMVVVADDEEYPDYVKAALDWWSARIQRRVRGSGWNRELIKEELASFRAALAQRIMEEIGRSGAAKLNIDIDPTDRMLLDAAETIGIDAWDLLDVFPRRTSMCVTKTCVKARIGSQRKYSVIWGNDE